MRVQPIGLCIYIAVCAAIALSLRFWVCMLVLVKGNSMRDTLHNHDLLFAVRTRRFHRFDIVLCRYPDRKGFLVKRIIALPGEVISMEDDTVFIDGQPLAEDFPRRKCLRRIPETAVPDGYYFVMGDNRPSSRDSRSVGPIAARDIHARVTAVLLPVSRFHRFK